MPVTLSGDAEFNEQLKAHPKIVVKFFAGWCGSSKLFTPKFRRMSENEMYKDVLFPDIDAENNPATRELAGVNSLPFFAVFKEGKLVKGDTTAKEETVEPMIQSILN